MNKLNFDPEKHEYRLNNKKLPSVTEIIKDVFGFRPWWNDYHAEKGAALHLAINYYNNGVLDWGSVDPEIHGRLLAYKRFLKETSYFIQSDETPKYSDKYLFAGTMDANFNEKNKFIIADYKSSFDPTVYVQLGGYSILEPCDKCVAIILKTNGLYDLKWLKNQYEIKYWQQAFLNSFAVFNLKKEHKI